MCSIHPSIRIFFLYQWILLITVIFATTLVTKSQSHLAPIIDTFPRSSEKEIEHSGRMGWNRIFIFSSNENLADNKPSIHSVKFALAQGKSKPEKRFQFQPSKIDNISKSINSDNIFKEVQKYLKLPDDNIDIGFGNLLIGKILDPNINIEKYLSELDELSRKVRDSIGKQRDPKKIILGINETIFKEYELQSVEKPYPEDFLLHDLLDAKKGRCMSLSALYMAIGNRLSLPFSSVCVPEHIFIRWVENQRRLLFFKNQIRINVETTMEGVSMPNTHYQSMISTTDSDKDQGFYLNPLTKKQTLATYLSALSNALRVNNRIDDAIQACQLSIETNPEDSEAWNNLGLAYRRKGFTDLAEYSYQKSVDIYPGFAEGWQNLGTLQDDNEKRVEYFKKAISIKPALGTAWKNLVVAYYDSGNYELAWVCANQCLALGHQLQPELLHKLQRKLR